MVRQIIKGQKVIGLSVSCCISHIIAGRVDVEDVIKIIGATSARHDSDWILVIEAYNSVYWRENPVEAERILRQFLAEGKIEQPRLQDPNHMPCLDNGIWVTSESEIQWLDAMLEPVG